MDTNQLFSFISYHYKWSNLGTYIIKPFSLPSCLAVFSTIFIFSLATIVYFRVDPGLGNHYGTGAVFTWLLCPVIHWSICKFHPDLALSTQTRSRLRNKAMWQFPIVVPWRGLSKQNIFSLNHICVCGNIWYMTHH